MNLKNIFTTFLLICSFSAFTKTVEFLNITRTDNNEQIQMHLTTDELGDLVNIKVISKKRTQKVSFDKIRSKKGATLMRKSGVKVARLQSDDLDKALGGHVKFIYLKKFNVFSKNKYGAISLKVLKDREGKWALFYKEKVVREIHLTPYRWGIKKVSIK